MVPVPPAVECTSLYIEEVVAPCASLAEILRDRYVFVFGSVGYIISNNVIIICVATLL